MNSDRTGTKAEFTRVCREFEATGDRPDVAVRAIAAPQRIAPHAAAWAAEAHGIRNVLGSGRLALAYDPGGADAWGGPVRVIVYLQVPVDAGVAEDALLSEVAWSWLTDALSEHCPGHRVLAGTVSKTFNTGFGALADHRGGAILELRASWTPDLEEIPGCRLAWTQSLAMFAGLPPSADADAKVTTLGPAMNPHE